MKEKTLLFVLIGAAVIALLYIFATKQTTSRAIPVYKTVAPGVSLGAGQSTLASEVGIASSVGNNIEGLLGVTPQGSSTPYNTSTPIVGAPIAYGSPPSVPSYGPTLQQLTGASTITTAGIIVDTPVSFEASGLCSAGDLSDYGGDYA